MTRQILEPLRFQVIEGGDCGPANATAMTDRRPAILSRLAPIRPAVNREAPYRFGINIKGGRSRGLL